MDARGGWHDAPDLLKFLLTASNGIAQMLLAWETHRSSLAHTQSPLFEDRFDALGQAGTNGLPDHLDEARWGLDWMLKLHPAPDQLYHQVADDRDHWGWRLPPDERARETRRSAEATTPLGSPATTRPVDPSDGLEEVGADLLPAVPRKVHLDVRRRASAEAHFTLPTPYRTCRTCCPTRRSRRMVKEGNNAHP